MKIVTAANHRFKATLETLTASCEEFGLQYVVYDLGGLRYGKPFSIIDQKFQTSGAYDVKQCVNFGIRQSRALFKPSVVKDAMDDHPTEQIIWLDADCEIFKPLASDKFSEAFDIGVAKRSADENRKIQMMIASGMGGLAKYQGFHNAGFIVFNPTEKARTFVEHWEALTNKVGNDQLALNVLLETEEFTIKVFPHAYNAQVVDDNTIINHKKGKKL